MIIVLDDISAIIRLLYECILQLFLKMSGCVSHHMYAAVVGG